jgi:hypothetical protein
MVTLISPGDPIKRRGRPPLNGRCAMTKAEHAERRRAKRAAVRNTKNNVRGNEGREPKPIRTLTQAVREDTFVRRFIDREFPHLQSVSRALNRKIRQLEPYYIPNYTSKYLYMLVGTAIDYRIRAYLTEQPVGDAVLKGLSILNSFSLSGNLWSTSKGQVAKNIIKSFATHVKDVRPKRKLLSIADEEKLCRYCVLLAHLDFIYRASLFSPSWEWMIKIASTEIHEMLIASAEPQIIEDVMALSIRYYYRNEEFLKTFNTAVAGETLKGSLDVKADFDAVIDRCPYDFKTISLPIIKTEYLRQLIGYWLLDYDDAFKIRSAAIYLTRQGYVENFDIQRELLRTDRSPVQLRKVFRDGIKRFKREAERAQSR